MAHQHILYYIILSLLGYGMGIMFAYLHVCGIMLLFNAIFYILVRCKSKRFYMF